MQTNVHTPDLENFLDVLNEYGKSINDPYIIDATQTLKEKLIDNVDGFRDDLVAFGKEIGRPVTFCSRIS